MAEAMVWMIASFILPTPTTTIYWGSVVNVTTSPGNVVLSGGSFVTSITVPTDSQVVERRPVQRRQRGVRLTT